MEILLKLCALMIILLAFIFVKKIFSLKGISFELGYVIGIMYFIVVPILIFLFVGSFEKPVMKNLLMLKDVTLDNGLEPVLFLLICTAISLITIIYIINYEKTDLKQVIKDNYIDINLGKRWIFIVLTAYLSVMLVDIISNGMLGEDAHWYKSRHDNMVSDSGSGLIFVALAYLKQTLKVIVPAVLIFYWYNNVLKEKYFWALYLSFLAFDVYFTGNRFIIASSMLCVSFVLLKQGRIIKLLPIAIACFPVMWFGTVYMQVRQVIHQASSTEIFDLFIEKSADSSTQFIDLIKNTVEGVNFNTFVSIFYDFPERINYLYGSSFIKPFVFFVPRSVWPDKPERISQIVGRTYSGDDYLSLVTTFFGEGWGNFGVYFIFFIPFFIIFKKYFLTKIFRIAPFYPVLLFLISFTVIRSSFGAIIIEVIVMFFVLFSLKFLVDKNFKIKFK